jgi:hypothetical protein
MDDKSPNRTLWLGFFFYIGYEFLDKTYRNFSPSTLDLKQPIYNNCLKDSEKGANLLSFSEDNLGFGKCF